MPAPRPYRMPFGLGMDNRSPETTLPPGRLRQAVNADILPGAVLNDLPQGVARTREGYTLQSAGAWHSLWAHDALLYALGVRDGSLTLIDAPALTLTTLATLSAPTDPMSYAEVGGDAYWSNGTDRGKVTAAGILRAWGVPEVTASVTVAASASGGLNAGRYQVCVAYLDALGEESAPSAIKPVTLTQGQAITITLGAAAPAGVAKVRVYRSTHDGDVLYQVTDVLANVTSITLNSALPPLRPMSTQRTRRMPPAAIVRAWNGRLWCAAGPVVWFSLPGRYGLYRPMDGFFLLPGNATLLEPVEDGLYVGHARGVEFWAGNEPADLRRVLVDRFGAVFGTGMRLPSHVMRPPQASDRAGTVAAWWSCDGGLVVGRAGGLVVAPTRDRLATAPGSTGAMLYRRAGGVEKIIAACADGGVSPLLGEDSAAEVIENGVQLP